MSPDYRNLPFKFGYGGLNLLATPENIEGGQFTRFANLRYRREGTLEARPGTEVFTPFFTQPSIDGEEPYPAEWNIGDLLNIKYVGKIFNSGTEIDGWLSWHEVGGGGGNSFNWVTFLNGVPVVKATTCTNTTPLSPSGYSVVRGVAKTGVPVIIIDGTYYLIVSECDIAVGNETQATYTYGTGVGTVPKFWAYTLGIAPDTGGAAVGLSAGAITGNSYKWRITYYNAKTGFESAAGTASPGDNLSSQKATLTINRSTDPQVDTARVWRIGGSLSSWRLVGTVTNNPCGSGTLSFVDNNTDATIATNELLDTDLVAPFSTVTVGGTALTQQHFTENFGPFIGKYNFWVGDPVKKGYVYWNSSGQASLYNALDDVNSVTDPGEILQNGFIFGALPYVFSRLNLFGLDYTGEGGIPVFIPRLIPIGIGLAAKWCFAVAPNAVYFLARDGIYATDCQPGPPVSLTETTLKPLFLGNTVEGIAPPDWDEGDTFRMTASNKELHWFYTGTDVSRYHLVFDFERGAWTQWTKDGYLFAYSDEYGVTPRLLFGKIGSNLIYSLDDTRPDAGTETFSVVARTGSLDNTIPLTFKEFGGLQIDADYDGVQLSIIPYYNSETVTGTTISAGPDLVESPSRRAYAYTLGDIYARSIALEFSWEESPGNHPILYQGQFLFREDEEAITHWESPDTSFGNDIWFHLKDGYFTLRSTDTVRLTVIIDNDVTDTYDLASTSGNREKIPVEFKPRRGKLFHFKLDSLNPPTDGSVNPKPFRFYGEESLLRGKPWITGASYNQLKPFGAVGYAEYRRTEGGT